MAKAIIVGAGPGGLTAGMLLASHGVEVVIYEKEAQVGGRNGAFRFDGYTFDIGPTFLMMRFVLDEMFAHTNRKTEDYLDIREIDPMYRLVFKGGRAFEPSAKDHEHTRRQIAEVFPGNEAGYDAYLAQEKKKYERLVPCLQIPYQSYGDLFSSRIRRALPYLNLGGNLFDHLGRYFKDKDLQTSFTFQAKYLGMSPWQCPALFSIISYIEHGMGVWHPIGGLNAISLAMAKVVAEEGGTLHLGTEVKELLLENGKAVGVKLANGEVDKADYVVLNADFADAMNRLVPQGAHGKWSPAKLKKKKYSCSTFMLYLGVDKVYDIPHHNVLFSDDYEQNVREIAETKTVSDDPSVYVQNAVRTDPTLAPAGHSTLYILVPTPNTTGEVDWETESDRYREKALSVLELKGGLTDLREHIVAERRFTPRQWSEELYVYNGATFNLAHNLSQLLIWRPHNAFEDLKNCYLVGGGTHPGSGLPTIYESGRISAELLLQREGKCLRGLEPKRRLF